MRDAVLEAVKRPALRVLHRSRRGEALLLRMYLEAEERSESAALPDPSGGPEWLRQRLVRHRADEARHAELFRDRLRELGFEPSGAGLDPVSRRKLARLRALRGEFAGGRFVPALAVAWRMETMAVRVFARHVEVLSAHAPDSPTLPLLRRVLADERGHVALCRDSLDRLVTPAERQALQKLVRRIDGIERAFGISGALALLFAGVISWLIESCTSPSRTRAAT